MSREGSCPLIRLVLSPGLAANITAEISLSLFVGGFIEIGLGSCHDILNSIQDRRLSRAVFS